MNHNIFEDLIRKTGPADQPLSQEERATMRSMLREYAAFTPVREHAVPQTTNRLVEAFRALVQGRASFALSALLVVSLTSVSVVSASERSLPGDVLYPVKVGIVEPVRISLTATTEAKTAWQRAFAERRLTEAAQLANQGRLNPSTEATLVTNFERYATLALATVPASPTTASEDAGLTTMAMSVDEAQFDPATEDFSARLSAHETVLTQIDTKKGQGLTTALRSAIRTQTTRLASSTAAQEESEVHIARLKVAADNALDASATLVTSLAPTVTASTSAHAREALESAKALREEGNTLLQNNDAKGASKAFKNSLKATARLNVFTQAATTLDLDPFAATTSTQTPATPTATTTPPNNQPVEATTPTTTLATTTEDVAPTTSPSLMKRFGF